MTHWYLSSCLGLLIAWQLRPVCSIVAALPDSCLRRAFMAQMDRAFNEDRHCGRIHDTWLIGRLLRGPIQYDPPPLHERTGSRQGISPAPSFAHGWHDNRAH